MPAQTEQAARKPISSANLLTLAFLNLGRHGLRAVVNVIGIAIAVASLTFFLAFYRGTYEGVMFSSVIDYSTAHGQFMSPSFDDDDPDTWLDKPNLLDESVAGSTGLAGRFSPEGGESDARFAPRLQSPAFAGDGSRKAPVTLMGVNFAREKETFSVSTRMKEGSFPEPGTGGVVIGYRLAETLGLSAGDEIRIQATTVDSAPNLDYWKIAGIFSTGFPPMDRDTVLMDLSEAQGFLAAEGKINKVYARFNQGQSSDARERAVALSESRSAEWAPMGLEFREWQRYARLMVDDARKDSGFYAIFIAILLFLSLSTMAGTMRVTVWERKREIGMLRASGWYQGEITRLFLIEAVLIGLAGGITGCLIGGAAAELLAANPISFAGSMADLDIPNFSLTCDLMPRDIVLSLTSGFLTALFAALMPAISGARMPILSALSER